jgi:hypothetical protein
MRGIAQLAARWAAAFVLDPAGVTRTKALGSERMARTLRDALPGGDGALRVAVWEFMRPVLSPALVALNRDAFVIERSVETSVDLEGQRAASDLDEPDAQAASPSCPPSAQPPGFGRGAAGPGAAAPVPLLVSVVGPATLVEEFVRCNAMKASPSEPKAGVTEARG